MTLTWKDNHVLVCPARYSWCIHPTHFLQSVTPESLRNAAIRLAIRHTRLKHTMTTRCWTWMTATASSTVLLTHLKELARLRPGLHPVAPLGQAVCLDHSTSCFNAYNRISKIHVLWILATVHDNKGTTYLNPIYVQKLSRKHKLMW